jgi:hypothetical protein
MAGTRQNSQLREDQRAHGVHVKGWPNPARGVAVRGHMIKCPSIQANLSGGSM